MSKTSEAIEKIREFIKIHNCNAMAGCLLNEAVALLAEDKKEQACPTCKGSRILASQNDGDRAGIVFIPTTFQPSIPCPDCTDGTLESFLRNKIDRLEKVIVEAKKAVQSVQERYDELHQQIEELNKHNKTLQEDIFARQDIDKQRGKLIAALTAITSQQQMTETRTEFRMNELIKQIAEAKAKIERLEKVIIEAKEAIKSAQDKYDEKNKQIADLTGRLSDKQRTNQQLLDHSINLTAENERRLKVIEQDGQMLLEQQALIERLVEEIQTSIEDIDCNAVQAIGDWESGMNCGLEDRDITDRYEACRYGHDQAIEKVREWIIEPLRDILAAVEKDKQAKLEKLKEK